MPSTRILNRPGSTRSSDRSAASTARGSTGCAPTCRRSIHSIGRTSEAQLRAATLAGLPIEVLVAPRYEPRLDEATNATIADAWRAAFESLSPGRVVHTVAWGAGHNVHIDRPDLVIAAVRRIVDQAR